MSAQEPFPSRCADVISLAAFLLGPDNSFRNQCLEMGFFGFIKLAGKAVRRRPYFRRRRSQVSAQQLPDEKTGKDSGESSPLAGFTALTVRISVEPPDFFGTPWSGRRSECPQMNISEDHGIVMTSKSEMAAGAVFAGSEKTESYSWAVERLRSQRHGVRRCGFDFFWWGVGVGFGGSKIFQVQFALRLRVQITEHRLAVKRALNPVIEPLRFDH